MTTSRNSARRLRAGRTATLGLAATVLLGLAAPPVAGQEGGTGGEAQEEFAELQSRLVWEAYADARPYSPYVGIPGELQTGTPFARSYIDSTPGRSECLAALFYLGEVLEESSELSGYDNPFFARSNNPDLGRGTAQEVAPLGPEGPHTRTENPERTGCRSQAATGAGKEEVLVNGGFARTSVRFDRHDRVVDELVSRGQGFRAGDLKVGSFESLLRLEVALGEEPRVSYRISIAGVEAGEEQLLGVGDQGVVLAGENVVARDLVDQFNAQVAEHGKALEEQLASGSLALVRPEVSEHEGGGVTVTTSVLEFHSTNQPRKNTVGDNLGLRLGFAEVYAALAELPDPSSLLEGLQPEAPPGPAVQTPAPPAPDPDGPGASVAATPPPPALAAGRTGASEELSLPGPVVSSGGTGLGSGGGPGLGGGGLPAGDAAFSSDPGPPSAPSGGAEPGPTSVALAAPASAARDLANGLLGGIVVLTAALVGVGALTLKRLA